MAVLNLNRSLIFYFKSFSHYFFVARKSNQKAPVTGKISHNSLLLASRKRHPSVGCYLPQTAIRSSIGDKKLAFHAITATQQFTAQTYFVLFPLLTRLFAEILMVTVFFEITIVHGKAQRYKVHKKILAAYVIGGQYPFID